MLPHLMLAHSNLGRRAAVTLICGIAVGVFTLGCSGEVSGAAPPETPTVTAAPDAGTPPPLQVTTPPPAFVMDAGMAMPPPHPGVCSKDNVCWELPGPQGHPLHGVLVIDDRNVYAVGEHGTLLHYDGEHVSRVPLDTTDTLHAVHGTAPNNVWVVGDAGTVRAFDGSTWTTHDVSAIVDGSQGNDSGHLYGVYSAGPAAVWIVGHSGAQAVIGFYDGTAWHDQSLGANSDRALRAVWGLGQDDVWAVGDRGVVRHYLEGTWQDVRSGTGRNLHAIHGADDANILIVGQRGTVLEWDGESLTALETEGVTEDLHAVVVEGPRPALTTPEDTTDDSTGDDAMGGTADSEATGNASDQDAIDGGVAPEPPARAWVFGDGGAAFRYNDVRFARFASGATQTLWGASARGAGPTWAVGDGGHMQQYAGGQRATLSYGSDAARMALLSAPDGSLWSLGAEVLRLSPEGRWEPQEAGTERTLMAGYVDGEALMMVGTGGTILRRTGTDHGAVEDLSPTDFFGRLLHDVCLAGDSLFVAGNGGFIAVRAAGGFLVLDTPTRVDLHGLWGSADDDVWAVGRAGTTLRWNGSSWASVPTSGGARDGGGDAGDSGEMGADAQTVGDLNAVWGTASDDLWAVGSLATVLHWNGGAWRRATLPAGGGGYTLNDVWGRASDDVYAVGTGGTLLHYDGDAWRALDSGTHRTLEAIGEGPDGRIRIGGQDGTLLVIR